VFPRSPVRRALLIVALGIAALLAAASAASAGAFMGTAGALPGPATPSGVPTMSTPPSPSEPAPSSGESDCEECACLEVAPMPSETAPSEVVVPAGYRAHPAAQLATIPVTYTFTIKTDANGKPTLDKVETGEGFRDEIDNITVSEDDRGCYKLFFDSRTAESLVSATVTRNFRVVPLKRKVLQDEDEIDFFRYPYAFGPKKNNATIEIKITLNVRTQ
jgi:hypothetical protein